MALPINICELINRRVVENARVEYKRDWNPEPILHSICAFANDIDNWGGGYIIIGVEEENGMPKLPVADLDKSSIDRINKELLQKCNLIEPRYIPIVEQTVYNEADIIILWIPGGEARPYKCPVSFPTAKAAKAEKSCYIRKLSNTIRANQLEEKELFQLAGNIPFDDRANMKANVEDMRASLLAEYLYTVGSELHKDCLKRPVAELAADMHLVGGPSELRKPLNVGLMFFSERPDEYFSYARIEVVDKPDPTGTGMTEKIFTGPLDRQLRDALSYIKNYIIKEKVIKIAGHAEAERIFNIPYAAVEEALSNAVYHKSYQIGEPITVSVTPDRMEITSLPGPDRTISATDIANRQMISRRYRNRRIGDFLKELKLVEGRNTGIPTMLRSMRQNGSAAPTFETDDARTYLTVILPVHKSFLTQNSLPAADNTPQSLQQSPEHTAYAALPLADTTPLTSPKTRKSIAEIKALLLETLARNGAMSTPALAAALGYTKATEAVRKAVRELLTAGKIAYTVPDNPRSRKQKLRLVTAAEQKLQ